MPGRTGQKNLSGFSSKSFGSVCTEEEPEGWSYAGGKTEFHKQVSSRGLFWAQLTWFCMKMMLSLPRVKGEGVILRIFLLPVTKKKLQQRLGQSIRASLFYPYSKVRNPRNGFYNFLSLLLSVSPVMRFQNVLRDPNPPLGFSLLTSKKIWSMFWNSSLWLQLKA